MRHFHNSFASVEVSQCLSSETCGAVLVDRVYYIQIHTRIHKHVYKATYPPPLEGEKGGGQQGDSSETRKRYLLVLPCSFTTLPLLPSSFFNKPKALHLLRSSLGTRRDRRKTIGVVLRQSTDSSRRFIEASALISDSETHDYFLFSCSGHLLNSVDKYS